ncbi:MAG: formylglycine-generating enzyme family protein [Kiritimatiellia bacterium]
MKTKFVYLFALFALPLVANTPPVITNVRASQREGTKLVDIYYDAADADGDLLKIRVEISDNDGAKYSVPAFSLSGDIGEGIAIGTNKHIVWNAGKDWDGEYSDQMRVKIYAIDAQGFPGLEWGNEVPPGGFLMGQDGGAEGSGPSRHINIPWSYWLSKYEITNDQYCDFLNAAYQAGNVYLVGTSRVLSFGSSVFEGYCNSGNGLCAIGDNCGIRWNVNNFEVVDGQQDRPALVTYCGATAFARFYGYDLPTDVEWEKAARGPDNDDQDEHLRYPWGNDWSSAYANDATSISSGNMKPVGYYNGNQTPVGPDTVNGYGLYDVIGNAPEWVRTSYSGSVSAYETQESLTNVINLPFKYGYSLDEPRIYRGRGSDAIFKRNSVPAYGDSDVGKGFRVARRHNAVDVKTKVGPVIDFNWSSFQVASSSDKDRYGSGVNDYWGEFSMVPAVDGNGVKCTATDDGHDRFIFYLTPQRVCYFTAQVKNTSDKERSLYLIVYSYDTATSTSSTGSSTSEVVLPPNMTEFKTIAFDGAPAVYEIEVRMTSGLIIDNLKFHVVD